MNPVFSEKILKNQAVAGAQDGTMTVRGTITKTFLLLLMTMAGAAYTWKIYFEATNPLSIKGWMMGGLIVGFILAMIISFVPKMAQFLYPICAAAEGLAIGGLSAMYNDIFAKTAPNIVMNAVGITLLCTLVMLFVYRSRMIQVNGKFTRIMMIGFITIAIYYLGMMVLSLFGVNISLLTGSSPLSIGISIIIVGFAAFSLLMDFNFIEQASAAGAPKYMEWYGAFGIMVTLIWLYIEILQLLAKVAGSRN
jgi:uncharacterized YccA/Bax inhibitor family protein